MADSADVGSGVFADIEFSIVEWEPSRANLHHGGRVKRKAQAHYLVAHHFRHDAPAGSLNYKIVEAAIKQLKIPKDDSPSLAGPGLLRFFHRHFRIASDYGLSSNLDPLLVRFAIGGQDEWELIYRDPAVRSYA
ncbi:hypothetical protein KCU65_g7698, partial [Aureobasidium melanogenum]